MNDEAALLDALGTTEADGTPPPAVVRYLRGLGLMVAAQDDLNAQALADCIDAGFPVLCVIQDWESDPRYVVEEQSGHWVVVIGVADDWTITLQDPEAGRVTMPGMEFLSRWQDVDAAGGEYVHFGIVVGPSGATLPTLPHDAGFADDGRKRHFCGGVGGKPGPCPEGGSDDGGGAPAQSVAGMTKEQKKALSIAKETKKATMADPPTHDSGKDIALAGHDGAKAEQLLATAKATGARVLAELTRGALRRLLTATGGAKSAMRARRLFTDAQRQRLATTMANVTATSELLGRARIRRRADQVEEQYADDGTGVRRFCGGEGGKPGPCPTGIADDTTESRKPSAGRELIYEHVASLNKVHAAVAGAQDRMTAAKTREEFQKAKQDVDTAKAAYKEHAEKLYGSIDAPAAKSESKLDNGLEVKAASTTTDPDEPKFAWRTRDGVAGSYLSEHDVRERFGDYIPGYDPPEAKEKWEAVKIQLAGEIADGMPDDKAKQKEFLKIYGGGREMWNVLATPEIEGRNGELYRQINDKWSLRYDGDKFSTVPTDRVRPAKKRRENADGPPAGRRRRFSDVPTDILARCFDEGGPLTPMTPDAAIEYFRGLVPTLRVPKSFADSAAKRGFELAVTTDATVLAKIHEIIADRLETGERVRDAKREIDEVLDAAGINPRNPQYSDMVVRTSMMDAMNEGTTRELADLRDVFPVWMYSNPVDSRSRPHHAARNGKYYSSDRDFADVRGRGPEDVCNDRCTSIPVDRYEWAELQAAGARVEG